MNAEMKLAKHRLTVLELAEKMGVIHSLVGKVEKGERRLDPIELVVYCKAMGADPCELLREVGRGM